MPRMASWWRWSTRRVLVTGVLAACIALAAPTTSGGQEGGRNQQALEAAQDDPAVRVTEINGVVQLLPRDATAADEIRRSAAIVVTWGPDGVIDATPGVEASASTPLESQARPDDFEAAAVPGPICSIDITNPGLGSSYAYGATYQICSNHSLQNVQDRLRRRYWYSAFYSTVAENSSSYTSGSTIGITAYRTCDPVPRYPNYWKNGGRGSAFGLDGTFYQLDWRYTSGFAFFC